MKKLSLLATTIMALPFAANAEWYVGAGAGADFGHENDVETTISQDVEYDTGFGALGSLGYKYGNGFRTELELGYRALGIDSVDLSALDNGDVDVWSLMLNGLYDINTGGKFAPYIGLGAGVAHVSYDDVRTIAGSTLDDDSTSPALQGIVGASLNVAENLDLFAQYQYQHVFNLDPQTNSGLEADADFGNSLVTAGLRWSFNEPKPMPVPVAAPAPAPAPAPQPEKYIVFFDFDRSDITIEAANILKNAAESFKKGNLVAIALTGHADRAGADSYNDALSARRADSVQKHLTRLGVGPNAISSSAKGERDPLVATDDGVREPQNRRVEIELGR